MITEQALLDILKKYGFDSKSNGLYVYVKDKLGICYSLSDLNYGNITRLYVPENLDDADLFIKKFAFYITKGKVNKLKINFSDYESLTPKVYYTRFQEEVDDYNLFDLNNYNQMLEKKSHQSEVDQYVDVGQEIIKLYDVKKNEITKFFDHLCFMSAEIRRLYKKLQDLLDDYNNYEYERTYPELKVQTYSSGLSIEAENDLKDKINVYKVNPPKVEEAKEMVKKAADLLKSTELSKNYLENLKTEYYLTDEMNTLKIKYDYLNNIVNKKHKFIKPIANVYRKYRKMDKKHLLTFKEFDFSKVEGYKNKIEKKYSFLSDIDVLNYGKYLSLAAKNENYKQISVIYSITAKKAKENQHKEEQEIETNNLADLNILYQSLSEEIKNNLLLLNTKFFEFILMIMSIDNYDKFDIQFLISELKKKDGYEALKKECFDLSKPIVEDYNNILQRNTIFSKIDFSNYEQFLKSLISFIPVLFSCKLKLNKEIKAFTDPSDPNFINCNLKLDNIMNSKDLNESKIDLGVSILYCPKQLIIDPNDKKIKIGNQIKENFYIYKNDVNLISTDSKIIMSKFLVNMNKLTNYNRVENFVLAKQSSITENEIKVGNKNG